MNYNEQWVIDNQKLIADTYVEASQQLDLNNVVWSARMEYDAARGLLPEVARWKHLNSLRAALSLSQLSLPDLTNTIHPVFVNGINFISNVQQWMYKGSTDFTLYGDFLKGRDITPILRQRLLINNEIKPGANVLNIFSLIPGDQGWTPDTRLHPNMYGASYYDMIPIFTSLVACYGFIAEWCIFTREDLMPNLSDKRAHISQIYSKLSGSISFIRMVNENHDDPTLYSPPNNLLWTPGTRGGDQNPFTGGNYGGFEPRRDDPKVWVSANDQYWAIKGYKGENGAPDWIGTQHATPNIEPIGFDEVNQPNRRSNDPQLAAKIARDSKYGGGATFHSTPGITSQLWGPITTNCAEKFFGELSL